PCRSIRIAVAFAISVALERDDFSSNRHPALASWWRMTPAFAGASLFRPGFARRSIKPHEVRWPRLRAGGKPVSTFRDHALNRTHLWLGLKKFGEAEVVTLELRVLHLAVPVEVDAVESAAEPRDIAVDEPRGELRKHRTLELEPFVGKIAPVMVVVDHH